MSIKDSDTESLIYKVNHFVHESKLRLLKASKERHDQEAISGFSVIKVVKDGYTMIIFIGKTLWVG